MGQTPIVIAKRRQGEDRRRFLECHSLLSSYQVLDPYGPLPW